MRDILPDLEHWHAENKQMALASVVQTWGSSPRRVGAKMMVTSEGRFSGSVSGGCVENAVIEAALDVMQTDQPQLLHFGVADETAWEVGLACGGSIDIFVQPFNTTLYPSLREAWTHEEVTAVHGTLIRAPGGLLGQEFLVRQDGSVAGSPGDLRRVLELAQETLQRGMSQRAMLDDSTEIFLEYISPPPTLVVVGGVHITVALVSLAKTLGYRTVVIDPRRAWSREERFPHVDRLIQSWPQAAFARLKLTPSAAVVMLTHDPKLDDPALTVALQSSAFYVGALGSRKTHAKRRERLLQAGMSEIELARLHAPVGLDLGAQTPEEIALAILAEVVQADRKRGQPTARELVMEVAP